MNYAVVLAPEAAVDLARLPPPVAEHVAGELRRLSDAPVRLSTRAYFPYRPDSQMFRCNSFVDADLRYSAVVLFKYGQDEQTLHVQAIGVQSRPVADDPFYPPPAGGAEEE
jgi:hypothetical protein